LKRTGETTDLKDSEKLDMQQKMVMADFLKSLAVLIAKQRNPKVPDMTLNDAVQIALKQNPDILNAIQQIRLTRGQLIQWPRRRFRNSKSPRYISSRKT
jgi:outer membrane protein TolC